MSVTPAWLLANGVTQAQLDAALGRATAVTVLPERDNSVAPTARRGRMNATESRFAAEVLDGQVEAGEIDRHAFEEVKFLVARPDGAVKPAWYTPDFTTWKGDRLVCVYEIKGFWRPASRIRIKVVAERNPGVGFVAVTRNKGVWIYERFS
jgi:hypothetical protein